MCQNMLEWLQIVLARVMAIDYILNLCSILFDFALNIGALFRIGRLYGCWDSLWLGCRNRLEWNRPI